MALETINLVKDQKVDLTKQNPGLTKISIGLGWDVNAGNSDAFDLDAFVVSITDTGEKQEVVYFGSKTSGDGAVKHQGDNLTGAGDGDDEVVNFDLAKVSANIAKYAIAVNIYQAKSRRQTFGMVKNAFVRAFITETGEEIMRYDISEEASINTGMLFGFLYKHNGEWKFEAASAGKNGDINEIAASL